jgi:hypothetical protein
MDALSSPLGPIWRAIINALWTKLFDPDPANQIYLPRILREGYKPWDLPPYDPTTPSGVSDAFPLPGIPQDVADSACLSDKPLPPIASDVPKLKLLNVLLTNISQMMPYELQFSLTDPQFTGVASIGTAEKPFMLSASDKAEPNYYFEVACCVPEKIDSRVCSLDHWQADASGQFTATGVDALAAVVIQLNTNGTDPATISILNVGVQADPRNVTVDFDVKGLPQWAQEMAQIAIQEGIGSGALVSALNNFLNQPNVKEDLEKLVNNALKNFPGVDLLLPAHH